MTPRGGQAVLRAAAGDGTTTIAGGSELRVDVKHCPGKSGWKLALEAGGLTAAVPKGATAKAELHDRHEERNGHGRRRRTLEGGVREAATKVRALCRPGSCRRRKC